MSLETPLVNNIAPAAPEEHGKAKSNASSATAAPPALTLQLSEFLIQESTGQKIGRRGEKKSGMEKREVKIAPELAEQYGNILFEHLQNLLKVTSPHVLDNANHRHELRLLESLTTDNKPDREKIKEYLETPDGLMISTVLIEDLTSAKIFSMGLHAATQPRGERVEQMPEDTIRMQLDQGVLNRVIMDRLVPYLTDNVNATAGRPRGRNIERWRLWLGNTILTAMTGTAVGLTSSIVNNLGHHNLPSALIGLAGAAVVPSIAGIAHLARSGVTIDLRQCSAALESIQHNPDEVAYLNAVLGIDVTNFVVTAPNQIALRPGHALAPNVIRNTQKEIFQGLYAREQFYTSLGIPNEALDALPEQYLYSYEGGRAEQTGTRWQKRLDEIFQPQTAGIRDSAGRAANGPNFLTGGATLDFEGNLRRFTEARRKMMMEMMTKQMIKVKDGEEATDAIKRYATKKTDREGTGKEMEKRKKVIEDRKKLLVTERDELGTAKAPTEAFTEAKKSLETAIVEFNREFSAIAIAAPVGQSILTTIEGEITRIQHDLTQNPPIPGSIAEARMNALNTIAEGNLRGITNAANALNALYLTLDPRNQLEPETRRSLQNSYIDMETGVGKNMLAEVTQREAEAKAQKAKLEELRNKITLAQKTLTEKSDVVLGTATENIAELEMQYAAVTGWGIAVIDLRNRSIDDLMIRINAAHAANPVFGWPVAQNSDPATRMRVVNAVSEAKAQFEETFDSEKANRDPHYTAITGWPGTLPAAPPITPDQLRTMSENQLLVLIHNINAANGAQGWIAGADAAELP
ncbi:30S ribosomal protein S21, partial [Candidatus Gottesmanbacteria bacterium]|nr:30S ribosomal protein S21 [Candidatus Gottesmanbacteria bacterium]